MLFISLRSASSPDSETPVRIDKTITPPVLVKKVEPKIPEPLKGKTMKAGMTVLEAIVTRKGEVTKVRVLRSIHPLLTKEAIWAVKQWKYKPALKDGKPVAVYLVVTSSIHVR